MKQQERIGARAPENTRPGLLGSSPVHVAENGSNVHIKAGLRASADSGVRILKDQFGRYVGNACVIVQKRNGSAFVMLRCANKEYRHGALTTVYERRPWGWPNLDAEFLNPDSPSVERYAAKLLARIRDAGKREAERRERQTGARLAERVR
jgi:hypothetical protein